MRLRPRHRIACDVRKVALGDDLYFMVLGYAGAQRPIATRGHSAKQISQTRYVFHASPVRDAFHHVRRRVTDQAVIPQPERLGKLRRGHGANNREARSFGGKPRTGSHFLVSPSLDLARLAAMRLWMNASTSLKSQATQRSVSLIGFGNFPSAINL